MHGCKGTGRQAETFSELLLDEGYAVFMPDSFKRPGRKQCSAQGRLTSRVALRTEEVDHAIDRIKQLSWVDQSRLVLMGFSEGGNTTDNWSKPGFAGHLVMGSACTLVGGQPAAPAGTPVLAVVGANDEYRPGRSCRIDESDGISRSVVLEGVGHTVAQYPETQEAIRTFLRKCCS
jgi:dienelactone hydrolase